MNLVIVSFIYLSILRLIFYPFVGNFSHWVSAIFSVLLASILFIFFNIDKSKLLIICYSLILYILNLVSHGTNLDLKIVEQINHTAWQIIRTIYHDIRYRTLSIVVRTHEPLELSQNS